MDLAKVIVCAYIDANILLLLALWLWFGARIALNYSGLRHAYTAHLRLLNFVFAAVLLSPFLTIILGAILERFMPGWSFNLADYALSHYLNGSFTMKPTEFEALLGLPGQITENLMTSTAIFWTGLRYALLAGAGAAIYQLLRSFWKLRQLLGNCYCWRRSGRVDLLLSDDITIPFSARGLRRFYIVIPTSMLARHEELKLVLAHEFQHIKSGDVNWEIGLEMLRPLVFWNPGFAIWKRQVENLRELSCDQELTRRSGFDIHAYAICLMNVCERSLRNRNRVPVKLPAVALLARDNKRAGSKSGKALKQRITALIENKSRHSRSWMHHLLIIPLVLALTIGGLAIHQPEGWSQDRLMLSTIVNLERLEARNSE